MFIHTEKSAEVFVAPTNQLVDDEVSHAPDLVEDKNMENSKREFGVKLIECVKNTPLLWESRLHEYKLAEKKPALWLEIADKLGSSAGRPIHCAQFSSCLQFRFQYAMTKVQHHKCPSTLPADMNTRSANYNILQTHCCDKNVTSESAILEMIDSSSEHHQIYRPIFNFSPTRNRPVFLRFRRRINRPIYRLVGPLL